MPLDGWVWLKSRMCRGLLHGHVCGVWGLKSRKLRETSEEKHLSVNGLKLGV